LNWKSLPCYDGIGSCRPYSWITKPLKTARFLWFTAK
jgi:hypothetical protein